MCSHARPGDAEPVIEAIDDLRCGGCGRLLARFGHGGRAEIRRGHQLIAVVAWGVIVCTRCGARTSVAAGTPAYGPPT